MENTISDFKRFFNSVSQYSTQEAVQREFAETATNFPHPAIRLIRLRDAKKNRELRARHCNVRQKNAADTFFMKNV